MRKWMTGLAILMALALGGCFEGPKGDKGDKGDAGSVGVKGEAGPKGDKGDKGEKGDRGDRGVAGLAGPNGDRGDKGEPGQPGAPGAPGTTLRFVRSQNAKAQCDTDEVLVSGYCVGSASPVSLQTTDSGVQCGSEATDSAAKAVAVCTKK